jgi:acetylornithine deacetylase/succinyl-diaminopimelate desuccinylase-like protein
MTMDLAAEVTAWLEPRADEMAAVLAELVAIDTENPPGRQLGVCGRALNTVMTQLRFAPELTGIAPTAELEEPCLLRGSAGDGGSTIYFHGHFDVVPAQSREQFRPRREAGKIIGRGSADMKGGIVSMLYGAACARDLGLLDNGRIVFHFVCDEETGSAAGSTYLREAGLIDPEALAMITAEPTSGDIWHANRGAITLRVDVRGHEAHVGHVHLGDNAFEKMIEVARPLGEMSHQLLEKRTAFPVESEAARGSMLVVGGASQTGVNFNVVPGAAWFSIDRRFNPEEDLEEEVARLTDSIASSAERVGADVSVAILQKAPSASTDEQHPTAQTLASCITLIEGKQPRFLMCPGVLETRWYAQLGIPAFGYGAGRLDVSHGPSEYVDEAAMRRCAAVYALFPGELLK